jgi:predicted dehydrogenase
VTSGVRPPGVGIGIVGAGDVAGRDYLPEMHRLAPLGRTVAIASRDGRRAETMAARYGIPSAYAGHEALLADPAVDVVVNLTQLQDHHEVTETAIEAGRHVYSEKPVARHRADIDSLRRRAEATGVVVAAAPSVAVYPQVMWLRRLLDDGALGRVWTATGQLLGGRPPWPGYTSDPRGYFAAEAGPLVDVGVYPLHALTALLGPVADVSAFSQRTRDHFVLAEGPQAGTRIPVDVDDVWHLTLRFAGGTLASVRTDFAAAGASHASELELNGEDATASVQLLDMTAPVAVSDHSQPNGWRLEPMTSARVGGPDHVLGVEHLLRHLVHAEPLVLSLEAAAHVIDVVDAAIASADEGCTIAVGPPPRTGRVP